jgi:5'-nucleotidase
MMVCNFTAKSGELKAENNIVYHIDASSAEPVGGIARFKTVCNEYRSHPRYEGQPELLTFFSGDAFNPSLESSITKGKISESWIGS